MKYLIKHKKEFTITIVALIVAILDLFKVLTGIDLGIGEDSILAIVSAIMGVLVWYFNNPTSMEGHIGKIELKQRKATRNVGYFPAPEPEDAEVKE
jgi:hypothetical protein